MLIYIYEELVRPIINEQSKKKMIQSCSRKINNLTSNTHDCGEKAAGQETGEKQPHGACMAAIRRQGLGNIS